MKINIKKYLGLAALAASAVAVFWNQPVYRKYTIDSDGALCGLKVVFISDLHNSDYGEDSSKLLSMIDNVSPDLIFFGGDIADEKSSEAPVVRLLEQLQGVYPMYYISGNHEYWMDNTDEIHQIFSDHGVRVLLNEIVNIETIYGDITLMGLNDPDSILSMSDKKATEKFLEETYDSDLMTDYKILLAHRPEHIHSYMNYDFDLILSGHAHGGQVRIPGILNGLYSPNQGFFPKYAGGYYRMADKTDFIVSRGLSYRKILPRIMNPPELVVLEFE